MAEAEEKALYMTLYHCIHAQVIHVVCMFKFLNMLVWNISTGRWYFVEKFSVNRVIVDLVWFAAVFLLFGQVIVVHICWKWVIFLVSVLTRYLWSVMCQLLCRTLKTLFKYYCTTWQNRLMICRHWVWLTCCTLVIIDCDMAFYHSV